MNKYLPVGSVVEVKNSRLVIFGYIAQNEKDKKYYDYICGVFPFGVISKEYIFINKEDIEKVIFIGFQDGVLAQFGDHLMKIKEMCDNNCSESEIKKYVESVIPEKNE